MEGPPDTPYAGGAYVGRIKFPPDFPFRPPALYMVTPSGRFETGKSLCVSMSEYHPESWSPGWGVAAILKGFLSFMCDDEVTTGSVAAPEAERKALASSSLAWNLGQPKLVDAFDYLRAAKERAEGKGEEVEEDAAASDAASAACSSRAAAAAFAAAIWDATSSFRCALTAEMAATLP